MPTFTGPDGQKIEIGQQPDQSQPATPESIISKQGYKFTRTAEQVNQNSGIVGALDKVGSFFMPGGVEQAAQPALEEVYNATKDFEPDRAATDTAIANATGIPLWAIQTDEDNRKAAIQVFQSQKMDLPRVEKDYPELAKFLRDPNNMTLSKDDIDTLSKQEGFFSLGKRGFNIGQLQVEQAELGAAQIWESLTSGQRSTKGEDRLKEVEAQLAELQKIEPSGFSPSYWAAQQLPNFGLSARKAFEYGTIGAGAGLVGGTPGAVAGGALGARLGVAQAAAILEGGSAWREISQMKDANGQPIDARTAAISSIVIGGINAGLEYASLHALLRTVPGGDQVLGFLSKSDLLTKQTSRRAIVEAVKRYGVAIASEVATEVAQEAVSGGVEKIAADASGQPFQPTSWGDVGSRSLEVINPTVQATALLGLPGTSINIYSSMRKVDVAKQDASFYEQAASVAETSKLRERAPEEYKKLLDLQTAGTKFENVYVDVAAYETLFQNNNVDPSVLSNDLGVANEYAEAKATGNPIKIPYSTWMSKMVGTPAYQELKNDITFTPDGLTLNQSAVEENRIKELIKTEQEKAQSSIAEGQSKQGDYGYVYNNVRDYAISVGRSTKEADQLAKLWGSHAVAEGVRRGTSATQWYNQNKLIGESDLIFNAIVGQESGGDYNAVNSLSGARGNIQWMPETWLGEARRVLGDEAPTIDQATPEQQDIVAKAYINRLYKELGSPELVAVAIYAGEENAHRLKDGKTTLLGEGGEYSLDATQEGGHPSVNQYVQQVMARLQPGSGGLFQFSGQTAETADTLMLGEAQQMEETGVDMESIRQKTGWFKGMDSKWRFEIDDSQAKFIDQNESKATEKEIQSLYKQANKAKDPEQAAQIRSQADEKLKTLENNTSPVLRNVLDHPQLYKAYPWIGDIKIIMEPRKAGDYGSYDAAVNTIYLNSKMKPAKVKETILHEIQHVIQEQEDFARGGSPDQFQTKGVASAKAFNQYERLGGEIEARDTAGRADLTIEERATTPPELRNDAIISYNGREAAYQGPRGSVTFLPQGNLVRMFAGADESTFIHESSHIFLNDMFQYVKSGNADTQTIRDWETLSEWFNFNPDQKELTTEQQEQFAAGFEAYLFEGKAPSEGLRRVFSNFRRWLTKIYRSVSQLGVQVTPEVKEVMDRMLATEDEIAAAEERNNFSPTIDLESLSESMQQKYKDLQDKAYNMAFERLLKQQMKELSTEHKAFLAAERERIRPIIEDAVSQEPIYMAMETVRQEFGGTVSKVAQDYRDNNLSKDKELTFEIIANVEGYRSGDHFAQTILETPVWKDEVQNRIRAHMAQFADLKDTEKIVEEAEKAIHNDLRIELMALEKSIMDELADKERLNESYDAMTQQDGSFDQQLNDLKSQEAKDADRQLKAGERKAKRDKEKSILKEARARNAQLTKFIAEQMKIQAKALLSQKPVGEASAYTNYFTQERRAAVGAAEAYAKGDYLKSSQLKEQQMLNHALARESIKIKAASDRAVKYLKETQKKNIKLFKNNEHFDQVAAILDRFGFSRRDYAGKQQTLAEWADKYEKMTNIVDIPAWIMDETYRQAPMKLTIDQLRDVVDAVKNIQHVANMENRTLVAYGKVSTKEIHQDLKEAATENNPNKKTQKLSLKQTGFNKLMNIKDGTKYSLLNPETILRKMDGYKSFGPWWRAFYEMFEKAANDYSVRITDAVNRYKTILSGYSETERRRMADKLIYLPEINAEITKNEIIAIALNWGNKDNRQRLLSGRNWNESSVFTMLERELDQRDWDFVQNVHDFLNSFWGDIATLYEELTGFRPKKVEAQPYTVVLKDGTIINMEGGYFPLKRDYRFDIREAKQQAADSPLYNDNPTWRASTKNGHTKERSAAASYPVLLDLNLVQRHVQAVVHDLTHRKAILDANKLINNKEIQELIKENVGMEGFEMLDKWIKNIAGQNDQPSLAFAESIARWSRRNTVIFAMGFRLTTMLQQITGFFSTPHAIEGYDWSNTAHSIWNYYGKALFNQKSESETLGFVLNKSQYMSDRVKTMDRDLYDLSKRMFEGEPKMQRFAMAGIGYFDRLVSVPTWLEGYKVGLEKYADETRAIQYADMLVRRSQGSGLMKDLPQIMRGSEQRKLFTMFYSYMNTQLNLAYEARDQRRMDISSRPEYLGRLLALIVMPTVLGEILAFRTPDDDKDKDEKVKWWAKKIIAYPFGFFPVVRDVADTLMDKALGLHGFGFRASPITGAIDAAGRVLTNVRGFAEGKKEAENVAESASGLAAYIFPYPDQFNAWVWNAWDIAVNGMEARPTDVLRRRPARER